MLSSTVNGVAQLASDDEDETLRDKAASLLDHEREGVSSWLQGDGLLTWLLCGDDASGDGLDGLLARKGIRKRDLEALVSSISTGCSSKSRGDEWVLVPLDVREIRGVRGGFAGFVATIGADGNLFRNELRRLAWEGLLLDDRILSDDMDTALSVPRRGRVLFRNATIVSDTATSFTSSRSWTVVKTWCSSSIARVRHHLIKNCTRSSAWNLLSCRSER